MKIWFTCFLLLFGATELLQWVKHVSLPLPIFILGGAFLAVASNYSKLTHLPFHLDYEEPNQLQEPDQLQKEVAAAQTSPLSPSMGEKNRRDVQSASSGARPISFTIRKSQVPND